MHRTMRRGPGTPEIRGGVHGELPESVSSDALALAELAPVAVPIDPPPISASYAARDLRARHSHDRQRWRGPLTGRQPYGAGSRPRRRPTPDDDLAAGHDDGATVARLAVLGPVTVYAAGSSLKESFRLPRHTEIVARLAAHAPRRHRPTTR
jgi:hypothetical protein